MSRDAVALFFSSCPNRSRSDILVSYEGAALAGASALAYRADVVPRARALRRGRRPVPVMTLRDLMGHEDASTTQRYVTVTSADKRDAIERAFGQQVGNMLPKEAEDPRILVEKR